MREVTNEAYNSAYRSITEIKAVLFITVLVAQKRAFVCVGVFFFLD